jgi:integrase
VAHIRVTEKAVAKLPAPDPSGKQCLYWDDELKGFGVLCSGVTRAKTFVVQREINGRTRRVRIAPCNVLSVSEARKRAEGIIGDFYRGIDPKRSRGAVTLRQAFHNYLDARPNLRPSTARSYRMAIEHYLSGWCELRLRDITVDMVQSRHKSLSAEVATQGRYKGHATANSVMRGLGAVWAFAAERDGDLPPCPVSRLRRSWFEVPRRERMVRADDLPAFYAAVRALPSPIARDYLLLLLFTGLRKTEAASLTWSAVDFAQRVIRVPAARTKSGRKLDLPMSSIVFDLLVARRHAVDHGVEHVFPSPSSRAGYIADAGFPLRVVAAATGIRVSAHDLRRTYITVAESCDISPFALKGLVNHVVGDDTIAGYIVPSVERLREAAQRVCDRMRALCGVDEAPAGAVAMRR